MWAYAGLHECVCACLYLCTHFAQVFRGYKLFVGCAIAEKNRRWHVFSIFIQQESAVKEMKERATVKGKRIQEKEDS